MVVFVGSVTVFFHHAVSNRGDSLRLKCVKHLLVLASPGVAAADYASAAIQGVIH